LTDPLIDSGAFGSSNFAEAIGCKPLHTMVCYRNNALLLLATFWVFTSQEYPQAISEYRQGKGCIAGVST